jgi:diadenosine tetraphosphate (Ap4A) HIT family hydrolase
MTVRQLAFALARTAAGGLIVSVVARWRPQLIPGLISFDDAMVVLEHPAPLAPSHLLAICRRYVRDIDDRGSRNGSFWSSIEVWLEQRGADFGVRAVVTNVGRRQEVRLLHAHLLSAPPGWLSEAGALSGGSLYAALEAVVLEGRVRSASATGASYGAERRDSGWAAAVDFD